MTSNNKQIQKIFNLSHQDRYNIFIADAAQNNSVWGLYSDTGWCLAQTDNNTSALALWPQSQYAQACAEGIWQGAVAREISLDKLLNELLPALDQDNIMVVVFAGIKGDGIAAAPKDIYQQIKQTKTQLSP